jgi:hypothetical protein
VTKETTSLAFPTRRVTKETTSLAFPTRRVTKETTFLAFPTRRVTKETAFLAFPTRRGGKESETSKHKLTARAHKLAVVRDKTSPPPHKPWFERVFVAGDGFKLHAERTKPSEE